MVHLSGGGRSLDESQSSVYPNLGSTSCIPDNRSGGNHAILDPVFRGKRPWIVLYDGVSVAIYMNGVAQELFRSAQGHGIHKLVKPFSDSIDRSCGRCRNATLVRDPTSVEPHPGQSCRGTRESGSKIERSSGHNQQITRFSGVIGEFERPTGLTLCRFERQE
jgi:hypothetical protein